MNVEKILIMIYQLKIVQHVYKNMEMVALGVRHLHVNGVMLGIFLVQIAINVINVMHIGHIALNAILIIVINVLLDIDMSGFGISVPKYLIVGGTVDI